MANIDAYPAGVSSKKLSQATQVAGMAAQVTTVGPVLFLLLKIWIAVAVLVFIGLYYWDDVLKPLRREQLIESSVDRVRLAWQAGVDAREQTGLSETVRLGKTFIVHDVILGGVVLSPTGDNMASFGQLPDLTWQDVHVDGITLTENRPLKVLDLVLPILATGLSYEVIVRIPGPGHAYSKLTLGESPLGGMPVFLTAASAIATLVALMCFWMMALPQLKFQRAALGAAGAKSNFDSHRLRWKRKDTFGMTARSLDTLIARLHYVREHELRPIINLMEKTNFAVIQLGGNGRFIEANEAAAQLFGTERPADIANMDLLFTDLVTNEVDDPVELCRKTSNGKFFGQVVILTATGEQRICFADITQAAGADDKKRPGICAMLLDVTEFFTRLVEKESLSFRLLESEKKCKQTQLLLNSQIEAYSAIVSPDLARDVNGDVYTEFVNVEELVENWYLDYCAEGVTDGSLEHSALDAVAGNPEVVRSVIRQSYSILHMISGEVKPTIQISSRMVKGGHAQFAIQHIPNEEGERFDVEPKALDWSQHFKALNKSLGEAKGHLAKFEPSETPASMVITMPSFQAVHRNKLGVESLRAKLRYPMAAVAVRASGIVGVRVLIDESGGVIDEEVTQSLGYGCDEEVLRVLRAARFAPALVNNKPIKAWLNLQFSFQLVNSGN